jgi:DNA-binding MarR family transcriptional regulator
MEEMRLIEKKKNALDKRMALVCLTDLGKEKRVIALKAVYRLERTIVKDIDAKKLQAFFEVANQIPAAIEAFKVRMQEEA